MEIKIDESALSAALQERASAAVANAVSGYEFSRAVAKAIAESTLDDILGRAVKAALDDLEVEKIAARMAAEMTAAVSSAMSAFVWEGVAGMVAKLRGISEYSTDGKMQIEAIRLEIMSRRDKEIGS